MVKQQNVRPGWPAPVQEEILETLRAGHPHGMNMKEIRAAMGRTRNQLDQIMSRMLGCGRLWVIYAKPRSRYYPTEEAMEAARPIVEAEEAAIRQAIRDAARERQRVARLERERAKRSARSAKLKASKPEDVPAEVHCWKRAPLVASTNEMPVLVQSAAPRRAAKAPAGPQEVVWPAHVKVQRAPTPRDMRFAADPGHIGEFGAEWVAKRAGGAA